MKTKKIIAIIISIVLILTLFGCSQSSVQGTVSALFKALKVYDVPALESVLTEFPNTKDCGVTYDLYSDDAYIALYKEAYQSISFTIDKIDENESGATVALTMSHPDLKTAYSTALYSSTALLFSDQNLYEQVMKDPDLDISYLVPQQIKTMYLNDNIKTIESTFTLTLTKQDDTWKIQTDEQLKNLMSCNLYTITSTISNGLDK